MLWGHHTTIRVLQTVRPKIHSPFLLIVRTLIFTEQKQIQIKYLVFQDPRKQGI